MKSETVWKCKVAVTANSNKQQMKEKRLKFLVWQRERKKAKFFPSVWVCVAECLFSCQLNFHTQRFATNAHTFAHPRCVWVCVCVCVLMDLKSFFCLEWILWQRDRDCVSRGATKQTIRSNPDIICFFSTFLVCWQHTETLLLLFKKKCAAERTSKRMKRMKRIRESSAHTVVFMLKCEKQLLVYQTTGISLS